MEVKTRGLEVETTRARFERLKGELLNVTPAQRRTLSALLKIEGVQGTQDANKSSVGQPTSLDPLFYTALSAYMEASIPAYKPPPLAVVEVRLRADLLRAMEATDAVLLQHVDHGLRKPQRLACYRFCVRLVLAHMRETRVPVTLRTVIQQCANVALVLDEAFPGYAESNLLHIVFRRAIGPAAQGDDAGSEDDDA